MDKSAGVVFLLLLSLQLQAAPVTVQVEPVDKQVLEGGVVYLTSDRDLPQPDPSRVAEMDQVNRQFNPHILVIQKGTQVVFPNSDSIKHHVYSFSPAKSFELELYKDRSPAPLNFDKSGEVELGCNVHDWMIGYIYVVDTPYFSRTNQQGLATLDVPEGEYTLHLAHPRLNEGDSVSLPLTVSGPTSETVSLSHPLLPGVNDYEQEDDEFIGY